MLEAGATTLDRSFRKQKSNHSRKTCLGGRRPHGQKDIIKFSKMEVVPAPTSLGNGNWKLGDVEHSGGRTCSGYRLGRLSNGKYFVADSPF